MRASILLWGLASCSGLPGTADRLRPEARSLVAAWEAKAAPVEYDRIAFEERAAYPEWSVPELRVRRRLPAFTARRGVLVPWHDGAALLDLDTGSVRWSIAAWRSGRMQAAVAAGRILLYEESGLRARVRSIDEADGRVLGEIGGLPAGALLESDARRVYVVHPGALIAIDAATLFEAWRWSPGRVLGFTVDGFDVAVEYVEDPPHVRTAAILDYARGVAGARKLGRVIGIERGRFYLLRERENSVWVRSGSGDLLEVRRIHAWDGRAAAVHEGDVLYTTRARLHVPAATRVSERGAGLVAPAVRDAPAVVRQARDGTIRWHAVIDPDMEIRMADGVLLEARSRRFEDGTRVYDRILARDLRSGIPQWELVPGGPVGEFAVWGGWLVTIDPNGRVRAYRFT